MIARDVKRKKLVEHATKRAALMKAYATRIPGTP